MTDPGNWLSACLAFQTAVGALDAAEDSAPIAVKVAGHWLPGGLTVGDLRSVQAVVLGMQMQLSSTLSSMAELTSVQGLALETAVNLAVRRSAARLALIKASRELAQTCSNVPIARRANRDEFA